METVSLFNGKNARHSAMGEGQDGLEQSNSKEEFSETPSIGLWTVSGSTAQERLVFKDNLPFKLHDSRGTKTC